LFLASKDETFGKFIAFIKKVEKRVGHSFVCLRSDHRTEFENSSFIEFCNEHGVEHNFSARRTPQQNEVVEHKNRTLKDMTRTMLIASGLGRNFWAEALNTSYYIINRCMIRPILNKTPYEIFKGRKPNIMHLRIFGLGLSNRSGRVGFVFGSKLNGLKTPRPEPDLFNKRVQKLDLNPFNF